MSSSRTDVAIETRVTSSNPLDAVPDEMPFDVPYGPPVSLDQAQAAHEFLARFGYDVRLDILRQDQEKIGR